MVRAPVLRFLSSLSPPPPPYSSTTIEARARRLPRSQWRQRVSDDTAVRCAFFGLEDGISTPESLGCPELSRKSKIAFPFFDTAKVQNAYKSDEHVSEDIGHVR